MMAKKPSALAGIFDDEPETPEPAAPVPSPKPATVRAARPAAARRAVRPSAPASPGASRNHGTKKPVLIHIPEDMHRTLRRLSVEEGEPLTAITERMLRQYLVAKGHTKFAP
jgi:hypothetical protein